MQRAAKKLSVLKLNINELFMEPSVVKKELLVDFEKRLAMLRLEHEVRL
jgi:hypothetical protein